MSGKRINKKEKEKVLELLKQGFKSKYISKAMGFNRMTIKVWQCMHEGGDDS